jgi:RsiW-degrading membrane proteinase PrsW (M82 family)
MVPQPTQRRRRPVGVWIATLWAGLFAGLFPLVLVLFFYFGPAGGSEVMSGTRLALSLALAVGIVAFAVGAWRGVPQARYALVALVVLHYGLLAYQNYQMAAAGVGVRGSTATPWARVVRSAITTAVIAGYLLLNKNAQAFFRQRL